MTNRLLKSTLFKVECYVPVRELQAPVSVRIPIRRASPFAQLAQARANHKLRIVVDATPRAIA